MRIEKSGVRYMNLNELAEAFGVKPVKKNQKIKEQQDKFLAHHKCPACKNPLTWIGGNIMVCMNENCKGIKHSTENEDGSERVWYSTAFDELDDKYSDYANYLFN